MFYHQSLRSGLTAKTAWSLVTLNTANSYNYSCLPVLKSFGCCGSFAAEIKVHEFKKTLHWQTLARPLKGQAQPPRIKGAPISNRTKIKAEG